MKQFIYKKFNRNKNYIYGISILSKILLVEFIPCS